VLFVVCMIITSVCILHAGLDMPHLAHPVHVAHPEAAKRGLMPRPTTKLESVAVVLPCAQEGQFAVKTIQGIWNASNPSLLKEILVVDDGSQPPLVHTLRAAGLVDAPGAPPVKVLRHERTIGLIGAKNTGGFAAVSDVIVFLDCHVKPRLHWDEAIVQQMSRHGDHRTVVVPQIGMLNADTWEEIPSGSFHKACFVSWDIDFPWLPGEYVRNDEVPVMSGGLLAISKQWWHETGGYDPEMLGWGGENIDQSLRSWLCGGRIELAEGSIIAHMFRITDNPRTHAKYHAEGADVAKNKLRAAAAWMGDFIEKVLDAPEFDDFRTGKKTLGNMSHFDTVKQKLGCSDFTHFLDKFHYIYFDSGYIPPEVYQIQEVTTGMCLERKPDKDSANPVFLVPCLPLSEEAVMKQQWQPSNSKFGKECCSGVMQWNTLMCLDSQGQGTHLNTWECQVDGMNANQRWEIDAQGQLRRDNHECAGPTAKTAGRLTHGSSTTSNVAVERIDDFNIRLVSTTTEHGRVCGRPGPDGVMFTSCAEWDRDQIFRLVMAHGGMEVRDAAGHCIDAAGEHEPLTYVCYKEANPNQLWKIEDGRLCLQADSKYCVSMRSSSAQTEVNTELVNCDGGPGQKFIQDMQSDRTFHLRNPDTDQCLTSGHTVEGAAGPSIVLGPCSPNAVWKQTDSTGGLVYGATRNCLDTAGGSNPVLYSCYAPVPDTQAFVYDPAAQLIRVKGNKAGGKHRKFEQCVDVKPKPPQEVEVTSCTSMKKQGVKWRKLNSIVPHEWKIWQKMQQRQSLAQ